MIKLEQLSALIKSQEKVRIEQLKDLILSLDSANLQTKSKEDFQVFSEALEKAGLSKFKQVSHAGRKINVYKVSPELKKEFFDLNFIELSEPKPGKHLRHTEWEYVSYIADNYDLLLKMLTSKDKVTKIRQIEDDKFSYYSPSDNKIQFRNKSIGETENYNKPVDTTEKELESELEKEKQARMKLIADFDNYRKSTEARLSQVMQNANSKVIIKLIDIIDDFERALQTKEDGGIQLIYNKLINLLKEENVEMIKLEQGAKYEPYQMEALSISETDNESENNTVERIIQQGYVNVETGSILRPTRVIVKKLKQ